jgi:hypothetical protein
MVPSDIILSMGSLFETNDTLQLTKEQGFPIELNLELHLEKPYLLSDFEGKVFEFKNKPSVRLYHMPPVRNFLVDLLGLNPCN